MKKLYWILLLIFSLTIGLLKNFHNSTLTSVITKGILLGIFIFIFVFLILKYIALKPLTHWKAGNKGRAISGFVIAAILIFILYSVYLIFFGSTMYLPAATPPHFRTNIFTNECDFGGANANVAYDPWYYEMGCDLDPAGLVEVIKDKGYYDYALDECMRSCERDSQNFLKMSNNFSSYCIGIGSMAWGSDRGTSLSCEQIYECPGVFCGECSDLEGPERAICEDRYLYLSLRKGTEIDKCNQIMDTELRLSCIENIAKNIEDASACLLLGGTRAQECVKFVLEKKAKTVSTIEECDELAETSGGEFFDLHWCYRYVAEITGDYELCDFWPNEAGKYNCKSKVAVNFLDLDFCKTIPGGQIDGMTYPRRICVMGFTTLFRSGNMQELCIKKFGSYNPTSCREEFSKVCYATNSEYHQKLCYDALSSAFE